MENATAKKQKKLSSEPVFILTVAGFLLRLGVLLLIITVGKNFADPYLVVDDIKYEGLAEAYINNASFVIDIPFFNRITTGYLQNFWPLVMCVTGYIFKNIYAGRFVNIVLSALCIPLIYKITFKISKSTGTATLAGALFAFMPLTVLTCAYPIKDIFITLGVFYILNLFIDVQTERKIKPVTWITGGIFLILMSMTRGAVSEILLLFFAGYYIIKFIKEKRHIPLLLVCFVALICLVFFGADIFSSFGSKIDTYADYGGTGAGIFFLKIKSITDIYKLPFTYFFASFQPIRLDLFASLGSTVWLDILTYLNISMYPIAIGNFIYIFTKKKNFYFWLITTVFFCAVIILSLGIFRHYLFLLPMQYINFALFIEKNRNTHTVLCIALSVLMLCMVFLLSLL